MEFEAPEQIITHFKNACKSARKTISIWPQARRDAANDYALFESNNIFDFIVNEVIIDYDHIPMPQYLHYDENTKKPVYGYLFQILTDKEIGYLAVIKLPKNTTKYKWELKSLHKSRNGVI